MKKQKIFLNLFVCLLAACTSEPSSPPADFSLVLEWNSGPLPPQYHYQYAIAIGPGPQGEFTYYPGYEADSENLWVAPFDVSEADLTAIFTYLSEFGLLRSNWQTVRPLIGGKAARLAISAYGRQYPVPNIAELDEDDRADVEAAITFINRFVPDNIWQEMESRQENYEQSFAD